MRISDWSSDVCSSDLLPRPEFREINRGIPIDQLRQSIVEERKVLRAMLQGAGVESRTCASDPTIRLAKPWSTEFRHNDELRPNSAEDFDRRIAEPNRFVAERSKIGRGVCWVRVGQLV